MKIENITKFQLDETEIIDFLNSRSLLLKGQTILAIKYDGVKKCLNIICSVSHDYENEVNKLEGLTDEILDISLNELDISIKTLKLLNKADLYTIENLFEKGETFLNKIQGFGKISMIDLKNALLAKGLTLSK